MSAINRIKELEQEVKNINEKINGESIFVAKGDSYSEFFLLNIWWGLLLFITFLVYKTDFNLNEKDDIFYWLGRFWAAGLVLFIYHISK